MTVETVKAVSKNLSKPGFVPPVDEIQLGWNAYVAMQSIDTCTTEAMRKGWLRAWRSESHALTSQVWESAKVSV